MIVRLGAEHVDAVARLHCASLTGLLSRLGVPAARAYYSGCAGSCLAVGFVDVHERVVRGFVLGSTEPQQLKRDVLLTNRVGTLVAIGRGILGRPSSLAWLLRSVRGPDEGGYDARAPELTYLAVAAESQTKGIGGDLVEAFSRAMAEAGVPSYELSVDEDNRAAIASYERLGFRPIGQYREFGKLHRRYLRG